MGLYLALANGDYSLAAVHGLFTEVASLVAEHRPWGVQPLAFAVPRKLRCTGLVVLWHVGSSRSGIEPTSPALAGGFFTT